jgi:hypothetical protein
VLEAKPVLLVLIGSDLSMMEALNSYGRPFHQRGREMVLGPLNPAEVGQMLGLDPAEAFDAALVSGGLPLICAEWPRGAGLWDFLDDALSDPVSALMQRALELLTDKRIVSAELPVSLRASKDRRYRVTDRAATGRVPTTSRSISSGRTAPPSPRSCSSWAPSSGWSSPPSTGTTWQLSIATGPPSPANPFRSWRSRAAGSTVRVSMPHAAPVICSPPGRCEWRIAGEARESVGSVSSGGGSPSCLPLYIEPRSRPA